MSKPEISEKIDHFLNSKLPFSHECEVVYLLVEIRKYLEHTNENVYPTLLFISNWIVHTKRTRSLSYIKPFFESFFGDLEKSLNNEKINIQVPISFESLREDLNRFLKNNGLPRSIVSENNFWISFLEPLIYILKDQPIIKPCDTIASFSFDGIENSSIYFSIILEIPINGNTTYSFKSPI